MEARTGLGFLPLDGLQQIQGQIWKHLCHDWQLLSSPSVVPKEQRLQATQAAITLMPDENREVLQTLLYFLSDITAAQENQMTAGNLAVCLAPSLFHLNVSKKESTSPR